ncbi:hypothetical protein bwei_1525 [Bacillus mycoides]|nr:hypothetical protein bwei_1525 [Bacillus mycoides]EEL03018.1 hypothetical protein bcere0014_54190 [Bacillus cereus BDRD-ST196]
MFDFIRFSIFKKEKEGHLKSAFLPFILKSMRKIEIKSYFYL